MRVWRGAESSKQSLLTCMNVLEHSQRKRNLEKMNYGAYLELEEIITIIIIILLLLLFIIIIIIITYSVQINIRI